MKKHIRGAVKLAVFLLGFALLLSFANTHLIKTDTFTSLTLHEMKSRSDIELALVGSSVVRDHFNVEIISEETGMNAFCATVPSASLPASIAISKELYRTSTPEWMVLVVEPCNFDTVREPREAMYKLMPYLSDFSNKLEYYLRTCAEDGDYLERALLFRGFGADSVSDVIKTIGMRYRPQETYEKLLPTIDPTVSYKGGGFLRHEKDERADSLVRKTMQRLYTGYYYELFDRSKEYLLEYRDLCEKMGSNLLVIVYPNHTSHALSEPGYLDYNECVKEFCEENGIRFIDFSFAKPELMPCLDEYYFDLYHMVGEGADILSHAFARVFSMLASGEDVSSLFHENRWQYVDHIDFITNAWVSPFKAGDEWYGAWTSGKEQALELVKTHDVYVAESNRGFYVPVEYKFVLLNPDGSETLLRDYSADNLYACAPGELDGQNIRLYARVAGQEDGEIHWYDLLQTP